MKLFVTDYDDTLYTDNQSIVKNIQKIKELQKHQFIIVIATGRSYPSIKKEVVEKKIPYDYLSCADGSVIYDKNDEIVYASFMDEDIVPDFEKFYQKLDYEEIQFSYPEGYLNYHKENERILGINVCISSKLYSLKIEKQFYKMKKKYPTYNFLAYTHPNYSYLCIKPSNVNKSFSIDVLCHKLFIHKEDVYAIGDSSNDIEMLLDYHGVGMTESCDEILKIVSKKYNEVSEYIDDILKKI